MVNDDAKNASINYAQKNVCLWFLARSLKMSPNSLLRVIKSQFSILVFCLSMRFSVFLTYQKFQERWSRLHSCKLQITAKSSRDQNISETDWSDEIFCDWILPFCHSIQLSHGLFNIFVKGWSSLYNVCYRIFISAVFTWSLLRRQVFYIVCH